MIEWTGPNQGRLRKALLGLYPTLLTLKRFVRDRFEHTLTDIGGTSPEDWAEELLEKTVAEGWIQELYETFCLLHQSDLRIAQLRAELKDPSLEVPIGEPNASNAVVLQEAEAALYEDPSSAHLVIAVFWQERSKQKIRLHPKLCYRDATSHQIAQESLIKDDCALALQQFPPLLSRLIAFVIPKLSRRFPDSIHPWTLTIRLFVPVDLLCQPLSIWCGEDGDLLRRYAIVMGCSDRFDPDRLADALHLHNQLKDGWRRFQATVPDQTRSPLRDLTWLSSDDANQRSLREYAGFQCYGDWLTPDEAALAHWQELVQAGIPLALWIDEGAPQRAEITAIFGQITNHTRFAFLEQIHRFRDVHQRTSNLGVGILYEDPHYVPDVPLIKEELFFSWPGA